MLLFSFFFIIVTTISRSVTVRERFIGIKDDSGEKTELEYVAEYRFAFPEYSDWRVNKLVIFVEYQIIICVTRSKSYYKYFEVFD